VKRSYIVRAIEVSDLSWYLVVPTNTGDSYSVLVDEMEHPKDPPLLREIKPIARLRNGLKDTKPRSAGLKKH